MRQRPRTDYRNGGAAQASPEAGEQMGKDRLQDTLFESQSLSPPIIQASLMETRGLSLESTETHTGRGGAPAGGAAWLSQHCPGQPQRAQAGLHRNDQQPRQPMTHTPALQDTPRTFRSGGTGQPEPRKEGLPWAQPVSEWKALSAFLGDTQLTCTPQDRTGCPRGQ